MYYLFFTPYMHTFEFKYCTLINISVNNVYMGTIKPLFGEKKKKNTVINNVLLHHVNHTMQPVVAVLY